jgi:hypothetical protein
MENPMTRTHDLVLAWTMDDRARIDQCFQFFSGSDALWRRVGVPEPGCLFQFVHSGTGTDSLTRRLSPGTEIRVTASASHDLVVTVSSVRRDVYEMLSAYEVANRIGVSHAPATGTGMAGAPCRSASLVRRVAHLTAADVETFADDDVVRPELNRVAAAQERQCAERGYAMVEDPVLFFPDDPDCVIPVDAGFFARDPEPRPRAAHGTAVRSRRCTTRIPAKPLVTRLLDARPAWLTSELAASATHLRLFVNVLQDRRSAATTVRLGHPARHSTRPEAGSVILPVYVPMTDEADSELAARLQRAVRFAETAEVALRRQCGTCRRSSVTAPSCRTTRSRTNPLTRPVLSAVGPGAGAVAGPPTGSPRGHAWSCGRCPGERFTEETIFVCPSCAGFVSQLDAMDSCPHCGLVPD